MSELLKFLRSKDWSENELHEIFWEQFGVKINKKANIYQFKYDDIAAKHHLEVTRECRGAILFKENSNWSFLARPFDKFFNITEGHCPVFKLQNLSDFGNDLKLMEKADGSLIILWWNPQIDKYNISTSGSLTTQIPRNKGGEQSEETFEEIFYRVSKLDKAKLGNLDKNKTYLFELCSFENRIITEYEKEKAYLIGIRENETGNYIKLDGELGEYLTKSEGISLPEVICLEEMEIETKTELFVFVEDESKKSKNGKWPEGYVLFSEGKPIAKLKNKTYLQCFHILGGDKKLARKSVMESVVTGSIDDIYGHLDEDLKRYADELKVIVSKEMDSVMKLIGEVHGKRELNPKDYALKVRERVGEPFQSFFFQNREGLLNKELDGNQAFDNWLRVNSGKIKFSIDVEPNARAKNFRRDDEHSTN